MRIIGKMTTLAAHAWSSQHGTSAGGAEHECRRPENFLYMLDAGLDNRHRPHPKLAKAMDVMFLLHAEHEMNCSTAACRLLASSGVDVFVPSPAVWVPHGPASRRRQRSGVEDARTHRKRREHSNFLAGVKEKRYVMFGFGHRVYKNFDPRAKIIRKIANGDLRTGRS